MSDILPTLPKGMTLLQYRLASLDAALTRKSWREVSATSSHQSGDIESIISRTYYLSDGGYSRVCIGLPDDNGCIPIFLDSVSRPEVVAGWKYCKELIEDVRASAAEEYKKLGYL